MELMERSKKKKKNSIKLRSKGKSTLRKAASSITRQSFHWNSKEKISRGRPENTEKRMSRAYM